MSRDEAIKACSKWLREHGMRAWRYRGFAHRANYDMITAHVVGHRLHDLIIYPDGRVTRA